LCFFNKELLAFVSDDIFQVYDDFDSEKLADKIRLCIDNYSYFKNKAMEYSYLYDFNECGRKYIEVFDKELEKSVEVSILKKNIEYSKMKCRKLFSRVEQKLSNIIGRF
jgi:hypothetical protein